MKFKFYHNNYNVFDLEKSLKFYKEALGLVELRRKVAEDESFILGAAIGRQTTLAFAKRHRSACRMEANADFLGGANLAV